MRLPHTLPCAFRSGKSVVIRTSTRQTIYLPVPGLIDPGELTPGELVGTNKDSYLILEKLPSEYDSRVKVTIFQCTIDFQSKLLAHQLLYSLLFQAMEVDEKPSEEYSDIGGCDKQINELIEAVVLPMTHAEMFSAIGIRPPKGVLLHGPPGTGKTLLARACAKQTDAIFLKLAGPQLVQMFIGDGAKLVRDAFELAKEKVDSGRLLFIRRMPPQLLNESFGNKSGAIVFIDELDAIGTKRFGGEQSGDREVQRTMLELLSQLDGFSSDEKIKVSTAISI